MVDRICLRHSTDKQTDARQRHALDRTGFTRLLDEAIVGHTIRIADAAGKVLGRHGVGKSPNPDTSRVRQAPT
ncbi:hypothetical protein [Nonomuraea sp. NPDC046570]|uniref:hypothetical protein n=1 Tax=Nonomuraea sp. NPDC046570 TaxID=3155255 RepID=UPI003408AFA3